MTWGNDMGSHLRAVWGECLGQGSGYGMAMAVGASPNSSATDVECCPALEPAPSPGERAVRPSLIPWGGGIMDEGGASWAAPGRWLWENDIALG